MAVNARGKARATTISDVARCANVVPSTVSHTLNGTAPISKEVRERVMQAVRDLNYRPNAVARSLITGRTMTVGMLVMDMADPRFPDVVGGAEAALAGAQHDLLLCSAAGNPARTKAFLASLASKYVDAVIVVADGLSRDMLESLTASSIPAVLVGGADGPAITTQVAADLAPGYYAACKHLWDFGHRRLALMTDTTSADESGEAIAVAAWERCGGDRADILIVPANGRLDGGRRALEVVLAAQPRPTALLAVSDMAAIGVLQAAEEQGLRIPEWLSVVGMGDILSASLVNPALTTVALPRRRLGEAAAQCALDLIEGKEALPSGKWLPTSLVVRRSTGAVPRS